MPIYEYGCRKCHKTFEYMQRMSDPPKQTCEACGGDLERQISQTSFQLKGGGWYKDLYSSPKPASGKSDGAASDAGSGSGAGSDTGSGSASASSGEAGSSGGSSSASTSEGGSSSGSSKPAEKSSKKARKGSR